MIKLHYVSTLNYQSKTEMLSSLDFNFSSSQKTIKMTHSFSRIFLTPSLPDVEQQQKDLQETGSNSALIGFDSSLPAPPSDLLENEADFQLVLPPTHNESKAQRTECWVTQPYQSTLPPLEDPSTILTSPVVPRKKVGQNDVDINAEAQSNTTLK